MPEILSPAFEKCLKIESKIAEIVKKIAESYGVQCGMVEVVVCERNNFNTFSEAVASKNFHQLRCPVRLEIGKSFTKFRKKDSKIENFMGVNSEKMAFMWRTGSQYNRDATEKPADGENIYSTGYRIDVTEKYFLIQALSTDRPEKNDMILRFAVNEAIDKKIIAF